MAIIIAMTKISYERFILKILCTQYGHAFFNLTQGRISEMEIY